MVSNGLVTFAGAVQSDDIPFEPSTWPLIKLVPTCVKSVHTAIRGHK